MVRWLVVLLSIVATASLYITLRDWTPDSTRVHLAVRATLVAMPTATPQVIEVTRIVEVTRVVEATRLIEVTRTAVFAPAPEPTSTRPVSPTATPSPPTRDSVEPIPSPVGTVEPMITETENESKSAVETYAAQGIGEVGVDGASAAVGCRTVIGRNVPTVPVLGPSIAHPDVQHGDLNLALRGYAPVSAALGLVDIAGPTDADAPNLRSVARDGNLAVVGTLRVNDWDWSCGVHGCRGAPLVEPEVSAAALAVQPGSDIAIPVRGPEIYGGGFVALVLYADETRVTLGYTRDDSVAHGYVVHLEDFCVDAGLVSAYRSANTSGRGSLPALRNGDVVGTATSDRIVVAVRDRGAFKDPRSRKDWWQ